MRNKKFLAASLLVVLTFSACGKSNQGDNTPTVTPVVESETPTTEPTVEGIDDISTSGDSLGEEILEEIPLISNEKIDELHAAVMEQLGDDYVANQSFDATYLEEVYGINPDWYDAAIANGSMMRIHVDNFIVIHAIEGNLENIYNALNSYRDYLINEKRQYPTNLLKVQGSIVEKVGDYAIFSLLGFVDEMKYDFEEGNEEEIETEILEEYQKINESVIEKAKEILK